MLKVKIIDAVTRHSLEEGLNDFLASITSEEVRNIVYDFPNCTVAIEYEAKEAWAKALCCDCQYWDDGGSVETTNGLCQECGQRRRFNCKACKHFKDIRR